MDLTQEAILKILLDKGVKIPNPSSVEFDPHLDCGRISGQGVVLYSGCKIYGEKTLIMRDAKLGYEGPLTIENCYIGPQVELAGGFCQEAVFLQKTRMGAGSHIRAGTILEEEASCAHTVGLKQTILFPYVTLGSLINFCDCLMTGGTDRKNHSEVGSSFIHFNYTPNQDKATPSLLGNVPKGVMLNQRPIFLGGQGGLVGPCCLAFGTVSAAGTIIRKDELRPGRLLMGGGLRGGSVPYTPGRNTGVQRILKHNHTYLAHLAALQQWYQQIRPLFCSDDFPLELMEGLKKTLNDAIFERIKRLKEFVFKIDQPGLTEQWQTMEQVFNTSLNFSGDQKIQEQFMEALNLEIKRQSKDYLKVIKALDPDTAELGSCWLESIVKHWSL